MEVSLHRISGIRSKYGRGRPGVQACEDLGTAERHGSPFIGPNSEVVPWRQHSGGAGFLDLIRLLSPRYLGGRLHGREMGDDIIHGPSSHRQRPGLSPPGRSRRRGHGSQVGTLEVSSTHWQAPPPHRQTGPRSVGMDRDRDSGSKRVGFRLFDGPREPGQWYLPTLYQPCATEVDSVWCRTTVLPVALLFPLLRPTSTQTCTRLKDLVSRPAFPRRHEGRRLGVASSGRPLVVFDWWTRGGERLGSRGGSVDGSSVEFDRYSGAGNELSPAATTADRERARVARRSVSKYAVVERAEKCGTLSPSASRARGTAFREAIDSGQKSRAWLLASAEHASALCGGSEPSSICDVPTDPWSTQYPSHDK
ncbi:hypothetical protein EDB86DRAFT_2828833 [Lactarius hatsudake]|nr:hypothetical protein EDB86DRAFT_2828833 [Lactarius hatsudake]